MKVRLGSGGLGVSVEGAPEPRCRKCRRHWRLLPEAESGQIAESVLSYPPQPLEPARPQRQAQREKDLPLSKTVVSPHSQWNSLLTYFFPAGWQALGEKIPFSTLLWSWDDFFESENFNYCRDVSNDKIQAPRKSSPEQGCPPSTGEGDVTPSQKMRAKRRPWRPLWCCAGAATWQNAVLSLQSHKTPNLAAEKEIEVLGYFSVSMSKTGKAFCHGSQEVMSPESKAFWSLILSHFVHLSIYT